MARENKKPSARQTPVRTLKLLSYALYSLGAVIILLSGLLLLPPSLSVLAVQQVPNPESEGCSVSVTTVTGMNGTHRVYNVTCSETIRVTDTVTAIFSPGIQTLSSAFTSMFTVLSIVSSIGIAITAIVFQSENLERIRKDGFVFFFATLFTFSIAIELTVLYSVIGPLSGLGPSIPGFYALMFCTLLGLGFSVLTLAGIVRSKVP